MESTSPLRRVLRDWRRRKVFRVAVFYWIVAWVVLQVAEVTFEPLHIPDWALTALVVAVLVGFPMALLFAWAFDLTVRGVVRTEPAAGHGGHVHRVSRRAMIGFSTVVLVAAGTGLVLKYGIRGADAQVKSIAVLPFEDLSERGDQAYFSDGIAEELLLALGGVEGLRVAARTSSFAFRGRSETVREIGRQLNVDTILEGSVRRSEHRVRINAQLIDAKDGFPIWSNNYERDFTDIFALQDDISNAIVQQLKSTLTGEGPTQMVKAPTGDVRAYDLYLAGRHHWHERTPESLTRALGLFEQALAIDPDFAPALSGLADTYLLLQKDQYGALSSAEVVSHAEPAIARALALDGTLAEAYASLGLLRWSQQEFMTAGLALRKAIELNPGYSMAHMWLGGVLRDRGEIRAAHEAFMRALENDPLHPTIHTNLIGALISLGRIDEAVDYVDGMASRDPDAVGPYWARAELAMAVGRTDEAVRWMQQVAALEPGQPKSAAVLGMLYAQLGEFDEAERWLGRVEPGAADVGLVANAQAFVYLLRGEPEALARFADGHLARGRDEDNEHMIRRSALWAGIARLGLEQFDQAAGFLEQVDPDGKGWPSKSPDDLVLVRSLLAYAYQKVGRKAEADVLLADGLALADSAREAGWALPRLDAHVGIAYALQDRADEAMAALTEARGAGWTDYWLISEVALTENLRGNPKFEAFVVALEASVDQMRARVRNTQARAAAGGGAAVVAVKN